MPARVQRLVIKFGSGILTNPKGNTLDRRQFARLSSEVAALVRAGHECLIVSSGAVAAGMSALSLPERPKVLSARQACAAVGQTRLMQLYATMFAKHRLQVAQLLLAHSDLDSRVRHANARNTLQHLLEQRNVVPIINENDSVAVEELNFGDNDRLSAEVATLVDADALFLLTSVDGLLDEKGKLVTTVTDANSVGGLVRQDKGRVSVGGMTTKLQAARIAVEHGITASILNGRTPGLLAQALAGKAVGTRFPARPR
ncbi:MAG TPA: glutamate 5-kinase [Candidatus Didemnitutus sp.]|nr:glutamate 5-kinase [Candidatus Didemnitutus sp.]